MSSLKLLEIICSERNLTEYGHPCIIKNIYEQNYKLRLINNDYYFDNCSSDYWEPKQITNFFLLTSLFATLFCD